MSQLLEEFGRSIDRDFSELQMRAEMLWNRDAKKIVRLALTMDTPYTKDLRKQYNAHITKS
jgi:hypothetical protein